jgi:uncharacterized protein
MSVTYKTPGVYVSEAFDLKVSIPNVATAIPAFFGSVAQGGSATPQPKRISNFLEFKALYGSPVSPTWVVAAQGDSFQITGNPQNSMPTGAALLYYAVQWYFLNGGGACYIVGTAGDIAAQYTSGLAALANVDEPTLIVPCGAMSMSAVDYHAFCKSALTQAQALRDRFCILDVRVDSTAATGSQRIAADMAAFRSGIGIDNMAYGAAYYPAVQTTLAWEYSDADVTYGGDTLAAMANRVLYAKLTAWLRTLKVTLPPSGAVAGVYATVDQDRGVWKAPANVGLNFASRPVLTIDDSEQADMNNPGDKVQVNAIRTFADKGILVWGARTLDFQSPDWTYISVRRLFIMMEESIGKAINAFVFEPNDRSTWTNVKASINSYLYQLWSQGALTGGKPEEAYNVQIGLGETMTQDDVLAGRMIVNVSVAPVRPAEFIIITFSQNVRGN